jgi:hypothetical protein
LFLKNIAIWRIFAQKKPCLSGGRGVFELKTCFSRVSSFRVSFSEVVAVDLQRERASERLFAVASRWQQSKPSFPLLVFASSYFVVMVCFQSFLASVRLSSSLPPLYFGFLLRARA